VAGAGAEMLALMRELYPIPRSLTGDGVRRTLARISGEVRLEITEVPTGTQVFDWAVPKEWNVDEAWLADVDGNRVVDFADSSLHLLGYSVPVRERLPLAELKEHLFTHPDNPDWIPYRTSYYNENWGFCLSMRQLEAMPDGEYDVHIGTRLEEGAVTYGEALIPGETADEFVLSTYVCHPALCNDNLSGPVLLAALGKRLATMKLRYSYRLLFSPGTIGPLCWLSRNQERLDRFKHGLVASCLGDPGAMTYKRSRRGDAEIDRAVAVVLRDSGREHTVLDWFPWGGDERQFNSPGFDLPVGALSRSPADHFPGYHSSADDFDLVGEEWLEESLETYLAVVAVVERNDVFVNTSPYGEPQLGKRGLYRAIGGGSSQEAALLWTLSLCDGSTDLIGVAERSGLQFTAIREAADRLLEHDLLRAA
jgi:aminopeptidase-like protein